MESRYRSRYIDATANELVKLKQDFRTRGARACRPDLSLGPTTVSTEKTRLLINLACLLTLHGTRPRRILPAGPELSAPMLRSLPLSASDLLSCEPSDLERCSLTAMKLKVNHDHGLSCSYHD